MISVHVGSLVSSCAPLGLFHAVRFPLLKMDPTIPVLPKYPRRLHHVRKAQRKQRNPPTAISTTSQVSIFEGRKGK